MATDSYAEAAEIDHKIVYHQEMEILANSVGDFTKAEHHLKMQEIYEALKQKIYSGSFNDQSSVGQKA